MHFRKQMKPHHKNKQIKSIVKSFLILYFMSILKLFVVFFLMENNYYNLYFYVILKH